MLPVQKPFKWDCFHHLLKRLIKQIVLLILHPGFLEFIEGFTASRLNLLVINDLRQPLIKGGFSGMRFVQFHQLFEFGECPAVDVGAVGLARQQEVQEVLGRVALLDYLFPQVGLLFLAVCRAFLHI